MRRFRVACQMAGLALVALTVVTRIAAAQTRPTGIVIPLEGDEAAWVKVSLEERDRLFRLEGRDDEWARAMERAITEKVATWRGVFPAVVVELRSAECRTTMCKIVMRWPNMELASAGILLATFRGIGLDHQGESGFGAVAGAARDDYIMIARRR